MKRFTPIQLKILRQLADGNCYSGCSIGKSLEVSRTAIWKQIRKLIDLGVPIRSIPQHGYQLIAPIQCLDEKTIRQHLQTKAFYHPITFHLFSSVDSTNQFLKDLPPTSNFEICCAETQSNGRGRFGRNWRSPFGENIYWSSRLEITCCLSRLSGLSLIVGLSILAALKDSQIHENIQLKWPNDLLWRDKKLAGILIEVIAETNGLSQVIIGIGVNINTPTHENPIALDKPWCSLYEITGKRHDRNLLLANLICRLKQHLDLFFNSGFSAFESDWKRVDYLYGKDITVFQSNGSISGKALGVNELGLLYLKDRQGHSHVLSSGDTSINTALETL